MNIWLPEITSGSGSDIFTSILARGLQDAGHTVTRSRFKKPWQFIPFALPRLAAPLGTQIIVANNAYAFAFRRPGTKLVSIEHHCVLDHAYAPYRSTSQAAYHELALRHYENRSLHQCDAVVAVSEYTCASLVEALHPPRRPRVILNGIDTDYFTPGTTAGGSARRPFRLLFVGNTSRRKGIDLLPRIMRTVGPGFELRFTAGLRGENSIGYVAGMVPLGTLTRDELREEYRAADALLFPTRFEGFGYAAAEALACGTPVLTSRTSSLPEVVDESCGYLCPVDDVPAFVAAIRSLESDRPRLAAMGAAGRIRARHRFDYRRMIDEYLELFTSLLPSRGP